MGSYNNQTVWITGASSGIGEALAYEFAKQGANLIISARRADELQRVQALCPDPNKVQILTLDLAAHDTFAAKTAEALAFFGQIDFMVHNAGISQRSLAKDTSLEVDRKLMDVNYLGTVGLTKALLPHFLQRKAGQLVVITSLVGIIGSPLRSGYAASKHALHGFFDSLRAELTNDNIGVTIICPGYIATNVSVNALTGDGSKQNSMDTKTAAGLQPDEAARQMVRAINNRKLEVYIGKGETWAIYLKRYLPNLFAKVLAKAKVT
jgi:dehydrogenase/reductase SDR family protein 7B